MHLRYSPSSSALVFRSHLSACSLFHVAIVQDNGVTLDDALSRCKAGARRLLSLRPRARILFPCSGAGLLVVNSSAGDRCVRFHETAALRRICRTRLDLPSPPRSSRTDGQGLFDMMAVFGETRGATETTGAPAEASRRMSVASNSQKVRDGIGTTVNSLLDVAFLPDLSVLLALIGGMAQVT